MLLIATDDLDGLLKSSMPGVNWGADPKLLGELADATRKDLAKVITNRIVVHGNQETAQIGSESYDFKQELGRGGLGVAKLFESKNGKQLVLKEPQTRASSNIPLDIQYQMVMASNREMANELRAHLQVSQSKHPNVLKLEDLCIGPDGRVRAVMEVAADGGDVQLRLHRNLEALSDLGVLPQAARAAVERDMAAQMLSGIAAMHGAGVVHHDLKGENVFLKADGTVQIADFGSGIAMTAQGKTPQVTRQIGITEGYAPGKAANGARRSVRYLHGGQDFRTRSRDAGKAGQHGEFGGSTSRSAHPLRRRQACRSRGSGQDGLHRGGRWFPQMPEYKDLLKEVMAARSTAVGKFLKARFRLMHSLDTCCCKDLQAAMELIFLLLGSKSDELAEIFTEIRKTTEDYYKAVIQEIKRLSAKDFSGTVAEADGKAKWWIATLQKYATQLPVELVKHKNLIQKFVSKYQEALGSVDWDALRTPMGGSKLTDKQKKDADNRKQQVIEGLAKAEMRVYGVLDAFDEVAPRIQELVRAIGSLVEAKSVAAAVDALDDPEEGTSKRIAYARRGGPEIHASPGELNGSFRRHRPRRR